MGFPLVYVVILNWHGWRDTLECLASLQDLDYPNHRVVVVDNGSTDDSVHRLTSEYPDLSILQTGKNLGFAGGNNVAIRYALDKGADYVWLLNNDTKVDLGALSALVAVAESDPCVGAVGSVLFEMDRPDQIQVWGGGSVNLWLGTSRHHKTTVGDNQLHYLTGASILARAKVLREIGLLDDGFFMYWEDTDFGFRLRKAGWKLAVASSSRIWHKESASMGRKSPVLDVYRMESLSRFARLHSPVHWVPLVAGGGLRSVKRLLNCQWKRAAATVRTVGRLLLEGGNL